MATDDEVWTDRVLCALGSASGQYVKLTRQALLTVVAARYASRFGPEDRLFAGTEPRWFGYVDAALARLQAAGAIEDMHPTVTGSALVEAACGRSADVAERPLPAVDSLRLDADLLLTGVITPPLRASFVDRAGSGERTDAPVPLMIELNLGFRTRAKGARGRIADIWRYLGTESQPEPLSDEYVTGELTVSQLECLVTADSVALDWADRAIYRIWPDFDVNPQVNDSAQTIKATAARRAFDCSGDGIVWAVIDSGIQGDHPHFKGYHTLDDPLVAELHKDFTGAGGELQDEMGHGTHVAAIIAGGLERWDGTPDKVLVAEKRFNVGAPDAPIVKPYPVDSPTTIAGIAPRAKLVSLKVLGGGGDLVARTTRVIRALAYVRETNAAGGKLARIHGVNLSLGYTFDPEWFACGRSPLCLEVDKLVRSGVVVVVAAGNSAYVTLDTNRSDVAKFSAAMTINDPGNAERAITVGSTHKDSPHLYGVSYFSSRGPTADGRCKPDLVAPGERIPSAAAGAMLAPVAKTLADGGKDMAIYVEESGTSMAAPHVSGAIAAFLSVQREYIGEPDAVKQLFVSSATNLGRERSFQGGGLVDLMRAMQSV